MIPGQETSRLSPLFRVGLILAAVCLGLVHFFPMWRITLWAPQYPEGLNLYIWANKLTGDLQTVNILNHYIGMAPIQAEAFPEMKFFLPVFDGLAVFALLIAIFGRSKLLYAWTLGIVGFATWALYDFWAWEFKFGHELSPDAAIKMDDMVYQPPLIGQKEFLNITAESWPAIAGYGFTAAVLAALVMTFWQLFRSRQSGPKASAA